MKDFAILSLADGFQQGRALTLPTLFFLLLLAVVPSDAMETRQGGSITIGAAETIDDTLFIRGESVRIDGTINGNVIVFGRRLTLGGTVKGDLIAFVQAADLTGKVEGNVYSFARQADVSGEITHSIVSFAQQLRLDTDAKIAFDLTSFSADADLRGTVGRDATVFSAEAEVDGNVARNVSVHAGRVNVGGKAVIGGNLVATVGREDRVRIDDGATIRGERKIQLEREPNRYASGGFYFGQVLRVIAAFLAGLVLFWLFPVLFSGRLDTGADLGHALLVGFLALVATPIAAVIVAITLVGLPLGLLALAAWLAALYFAKILVAAVLGRTLLHADAARPGGFALALLLGLLLVFVAINIPYVGGILHLLLILAGMGLAALALRRRWRAQPTAA